MAENVENKNIKYYGVYYATNGDIMLVPGDTQEECLTKLEERLAKGQQWVDLCKGTTVIKRDLSTLANPEFIFGCAKSLDVKNNPRKKKK